MVYTSNIPQSSLTDEEKILEKRVLDLISACENRNAPRFSSFLDERQQLVVMRAYALEKSKVGCLFFGGYDDAQRKMFAALPSYLGQDCTELFPIVPITATFSKKYKLSHRDFLGALMNLRITRDSVGDILVGEGLAVIFVKDTVAQAVLNELQRVGSLEVKTSIGLPDELPSMSELLPISGTVSSLRVDNIVALLTKSSREQVSKLIKSGMVTVNSVQCTSQSKSLAEGDKIAVRGYGKFKFTEIGGATKKERIHITCHKYI